VWVDRELIEIALRQLIDNALKYSPRDSPVSVAAESGDGRVIVSVADCGPGIPEEEQSRIFEKFYRAEASRHQIPGAGLGLVIAREDHPGSWGRNLGGEQTRRGVQLSLFSPNFFRSEATMSLGRILVVDDDPQIRRVMRTTLAGEGYEVEDARSGEETLEKLRADRYDLMLLDINMPGMGGLETCRQVRAASDMAIVMLTVRNTEQDKVQALDAGADDFITKPFSTPELLARIRAALRRTPSSPEAGPQRITLDNVEIDFQSRKLIVSGNEVRLTPKNSTCLDI